MRPHKASRRHSDGRYGYGYVGAHGGQHGGGKGGRHGGRLVCRHSGQKGTQFGKEKKKGYLIWRENEPHGLVG